jgi:hypothetical protein
MSAQKRERVDSTVVDQVSQRRRTMIPVVLTVASLMSTTLVDNIGIDAAVDLRQ